MKTRQIQNGTGGWKSTRQDSSCSPDARPNARPMRRTWCRRQFSNPGNGGETGNRRRRLLFLQRFGEGQSILHGGPIVEKGGRFWRLKSPRRSGLTRNRKIGS